MKKNILKGLFILIAGLILSFIICSLFYFILPIPNLTFSEHVYSFYSFLFRTFVVSLMIGGLTLLPVYLILKLYKKLFTE